MHGGAGAEGELPSAAGAGIEARAGAMVGEMRALGLIGAAAVAGQTTRKADGLEKREACRLVRHDPLDRGEGDIMRIAADGAMDMAHDHPHWRSVRETKSAQTQDLGADVSAG